MPSQLEDELYASALRYMDKHLPRSQKPKKATPYTKATGVNNNSVLSSPTTLPILPPATSLVASNLAIQGTSNMYPPSFQESIDKALQNAWAPATLKTYSTGINAYINFCRLHQIPPSLVFPASEFLLCAFFASKQGLSPATLKNYIAGLRAWHTRENHKFPTSDRLKLIIKTSVPISSTPPKHAISLPMLECLALNLSNSPFDIAVLAIASTAFWGLCRLGELLPLSPPGLLQPPRQPQLSHVYETATDELRVFLPYTKVMRQKGESVFLAQQLGPSNPILALQNHLKMRLTANTSLLFSYDLHGTNHCITKGQFLSRCNTIWTAHKFPRSTGHSFRIGGTTHLLLCGIDPNIIKKAGRWASDSYLRYWRNLDAILPAGVRFASSSSRPSMAGEPRRSHGCGRADLG